jgi:hypothetical protein
MDIFDLTTDTDAAYTPTAQPTPLSQIRMFKSDRGHNINIAEIVKSYQEEGLDSVEVIAIPSVVREQRRGEDKSDVTTLSEVGVASVSYGTSFDYGQVIAGVDARPVNIDNVLFVTGDPANTTINHGTAGVEIGSYFALGWKRKADALILIYRVIGSEEYGTTAEPQRTGGRESTRPQKKPRPVAKLTCELQGYSTRTWKGEDVDVPEELAALHAAAKERLTSEYPATFYMDTIRMIGSTEGSRAVAGQMQQRIFGGVEEYAPEQFRRKVTAEIIDIRNGQYAKLPTGPDAKRKVQPLPAIETLELDREQNTIAIELVIPRDDDALAVHLRTTLTPENFHDATGRVVLERGLVLKAQTFERLRSELEGRRDPVISVHLASIR